MIAILGFLLAAAESKARVERLRPLCTESEWAAARRLALESMLNIEQAVAVTLSRAIEPSNHRGAGGPEDPQ